MKLAPETREILQLYTTGRIRPVCRMAGVWAGGPVSPRAKPLQAAPAGEKLRRASCAAHSLLHCQSLLPGNAHEYIKPVDEQQKGFL